MESVLSVKDLSVQFINNKKITDVVDGLSFELRPGEVLGVVGESGCGKSVTSLAIMRLLPESARISSGEIVCDGKKLLNLSEKEMCDLRGNLISMIFQDPMTALNPTSTIGKQLIEPFIIHQGCNKAEALSRSVEMLRKVGISSPEERMNEYPHQLSGGILQRIVIATALACKPKVLIADEPTTALDVTIQAQILDLIKELCEELRTAVLLITHDMGVVAETADRVMVMYAGRLAEYGNAKSLFSNPRHPYTSALIRAIPSLDKDVDKLNQIPGTIPVFGNMPTGCRFAPRCEKCMEICNKETPGIYNYDGELVSCFKYRSTD